MIKSNPNLIGLKALNIKNNVFEKYTCTILRTDFPSLRLEFVAITFNEIIYKKRKLKIDLFIEKKRRCVRYSYPSGQVDKSGEQV